MVAACPACARYLRSRRHYKSDFDVPLGIHLTTQLTTVNHPRIARLFQDRLHRNPEIGDCRSLSVGPLVLAWVLGEVPS